MQRRRFRPGDWVVYRKPKHSTSPGPRAIDLHPAPRGEDYVYQVDKFWVVVECRDDGQIVVRTRRGKQHVLKQDDPHLRPANWWERLRYRARFQSILDAEQPAEQPKTDQPSLPDSP